MKLQELFDKSRQMYRKEHRDKEAGKIGNLRAGSSGIMSETGEVAGACVRRSHLRQLGIDSEPDIPEDKLIMFDMGYASEDIVFDKLKKALEGTSYTILREEEIPIEWKTTNSTLVTGRPDIVVVDRSTVYTGMGKVRTPHHTDTPVLGIELKSVHSLWVARDVLFGRKPKLANLIQATHYMWKLGIPYKLVYTCYSQLGQGMAGNEWIIKQFPKAGEPGSEYVEYSTAKKARSGNATIKHIKQFEIIYDLKLDSHGRLYYKLEKEEDSQWTPTIVTTGYINEYFEYVSRMEKDRTLGPRPSSLDIHGAAAGYKDCDYCPLRQICDSHEGLGYKKWLAAVKKEVLKVGE